MDSWSPYAVDTCRPSPDIGLLEAIPPRCCMKQTPTPCSELSLTLSCVLDNFLVFLVRQCQTVSEPSMVLGYSKGILSCNSKVYVLACHNTKAIQPGGINIESKHDSVIVVAADTRLDCPTNHEHRYIYMGACSACVIHTTIVTVEQVTNLHNMFTRQ